MAINSPEDLIEIERNMTPASLYEHLFADETWKPRLQATETPAPSIETSHDVKTPEVLEESLARRRMAISLRDAAVEAGTVVELKDTPKETVITTERALGRYGATIAAEQGLPPTLAVVAEVQVNELLSARESDVVDVPSLALGALALIRMEAADTDPIERKAASFALRSLPRDPQQIELVKHFDLSHNTGELAVRAIMEHQPLNA